VQILQVGWAWCRLGNSGDRRFPHPCPTDSTGSPSDFGHIWPGDVITAWKCWT
jgi:hypothetical protein